MLPPVAPALLFNGGGKRTFPVLRDGNALEGPDREDGPFCRLILIEVVRFEEL